MEIKFKAYVKEWDKIVKVYGLCWQGNQLQVEVLQEEFNGSEKDVLNYSKNFVYWINEKECDLLQYAGSKDKEGKEIYKNLKLVEKL